MPVTPNARSNQGMKALFADEADEATYHLLAVTHDEDEGRVIALELNEVTIVGRAIARLTRL